MNYSSIGQQKIMLSLFSGIATKECQHNFYKIRVTDMNEKFVCNFEVQDQITICENIQLITKDPWLKQVKEHGIKLTDVGKGCETVEILISADIMAKMLTEKRKVLTSDLVAVETCLGWTLMGKVPQVEVTTDYLTMAVPSLLVNEADITNLLRLDLNGKTDFIEKKSKAKIDCETKNNFLETIKLNNDHHYEAYLPSADDKTT